MKGKFQKRLTSNDIKQRLSYFLLSYEQTQIEDLLDPVYAHIDSRSIIRQQKIANEASRMMEIYIQDIEQMLRKEQDRWLISQIKSNTKHYVQVFYDIIQKNMPQRNVPVAQEDILRYELENSLEKQRKQNESSSFNAQNQKIPSEMHRKWSITIVYKTIKQGMVKSIRELTAEHIGAVVVLKGIVIRTEAVKPRLAIATFTCDVCGSENYLQVNQDYFHMLNQCHSKKCVENNVSGKLTFMTKHSHFVPSQIIKVQETPDQLKQGNIPLNMKFILTHNNIRKVQPGDVVIIQGVVMPKRKEGFAHQQDLTFQVCMQAFQVVPQKKKYTDVAMGEEQHRAIDKLRSDYSSTDLFNILSESICPQIYGMEYVKKALLLLLAGGVTTKTNDGLRIRGQLNVLLLGDPGLAKSQLLKYISTIAPRGVYTTGKGSTDVGLTAGVKIDPVTRDVSLQAGALVLADQGVCCIDEFDKMQAYDQTAIHEVMQQQTVSIAKAGITTTLNARTSILAAANPQFGRYNIKQSARTNINLPAALLSRFDLIFILLDKHCQQDDLQLARHIGEVHMTKQAKQKKQLLKSSDLRNYIGLAKAYEPKIPEHLSSQIIERYVKNRHLYASGQKQKERYITTRNLLALIRLCQARAKLRFSNEVNQQDILDCQEIMQKTQLVENGGRDDMRNKINSDKCGSIFNLIKQMWFYATDTIDNQLIIKRVNARGYSTDDLRRALKTYGDLGLLQIEKNGSVRLLVQ